MAPYAEDAGAAASFVAYHDQAYALVALTHALTDYGARPCAANASALAAELRALRAAAAAAADDGDTGMAAAAADALLLCGRADTPQAGAAVVETDTVEQNGGAVGGGPSDAADEHVAAARRVLAQLVASQRADGGWGPPVPAGKVSQDAYHPTCSAALALSSGVGRAKDEL